MANKRKHSLPLVAGTSKMLRFFGRPCCVRQAELYSERDVIDFRSLCIVSSIFSFGTFGILMFYPPVMYTLFGLDGAPSTDVMSRRAGILFLSVGTILWLQRNLIAEEAKAALARGMFVFMAGFVVLGVIEFFRGAVSAGVFFPVSIELVMALLFMKHVKNKSD